SIHKVKYFDQTTDTTSYGRTKSGTTKKQILLVTYGRSGSTFTSALINRHKDVFFVFEPLFVLEKSISLDTKENDSMAIVKAFMECNIPTEYSFALDNYLYRNSDTTRNFYRCMASLKKGAFHVSCFLQLLDACRRQRVTFVKTIRFQVKWAEALLARNPNFKLLYLVRDPRATLFSQARVFRNFNWNTQVFNISQQHCTNLQLDLQDAERLYHLYPGQVKGIRYEHGATDPLTYTRDIYKFIDLPFDNDLVEYITNITKAPIDSPKVNSSYSVLRHNSTQTMNRWRFMVGFNSVREVDQACGHLYSKLGYRTVASQKHLVSESSLVISPQPSGIFS
ncbi:unnamed protein product, partial [Candidula unifasciata]